MGWLDARRPVAITLLSLALAVVAALLLLGPLRGVQAPVPGLPWWLLLPAFTLAELVVVHVQARRESLSVSFREIPLVLGLVFLGPIGLVLASVLGSAVGLLRRRPTREKLVFNLCLFAFEATLAVTLYQLALGGAAPQSPRGLLAALATVVVTDLVSATAITAVIWLKAGRFDDGVLVEAVTTGLVAAVTNASLALLVVVLVDTRPVALLLLLAVVTTVVLAYRGYSGLIQGHARLESVYRFTRRVQTELTTDDVAEAVLREARDDLAAETAELLLLPGPADDGRRLRLSGESVRASPLVVAPWLQPVLDDQVPLRRADDPGPGPRDALAVPLGVEGDLLGVLVVEGRPRHLGAFGSKDLRLFESLASHAALSLEKTRLLDRLRAYAGVQERLSLHDPLTGLPNRRHLLRILATELAADAPTGVLVLDLAGFTDINEVFGYETGDQLLVQVGQRLSGPTSMRGNVARVGNDELVVVLRDVGDAMDAVRVAEAVIASMHSPFVVAGLTFDLRADAGLAVAPQHGRDAELLLQRADAAMYAAKRDRATLRVWDPATEGASARRLSLLRHLREAIEDGGLEVLYQPKVDPATGLTVGAEALARWADPLHGVVNPDEFVPLAEQSGLIHPLTGHVLDTALADCARWRRRRPEMTVAVNLSARSLLNPRLPRQVRTSLAYAGLPAAALTLELTETAVMTDLDLALVVLHEVAALGVKLSIDDFGTGQSSLAYLKQLPVDELKVDRSFVQGAASDDGDAAIVRAAIDLGHTHGLAVVAEGVEDDATQTLLASWGSDVIQGFHVSRPLSADGIQVWLDEHPGVPSPRGGATERLPD